MTTLEMASPKSGRDLPKTDTNFNNPQRRSNVPVSSILETRRLERDEIQSIQAAKMKRSTFVRKLIFSFFGEFLARCFLLALSGLCLWRLTQSFFGFPIWGFALLAVGVTLSLCDCILILWYRTKVYGYWHFYKYVHWRGRSWFDPNTLFCLMTIVPTLACTELAIYNARHLELYPPLPVVTLPATMSATGNVTTVSEVSTLGSLLRRRRDVTSVNVASSGDFTTLTTMPTAASAMPTSASSTSSLTSVISISTAGQGLPRAGNTTDNATAPTSSANSTTTARAMYYRDLSLYLLHHVTCLLLVLIRLQIRRPEGLQRLQLNSLVFELLLHAVDLDNLIVDGLNEVSVLADHSLFVGVMCVWGVGFVVMVFILSRRHEVDLLFSDRKKLETFYHTVVVALQDAPRLGLRIAIIVKTSQMLATSGTYTMLFAMKNVVCLALYGHRVLVLWDAEEYSQSY